MFLTTFYHHDPHKLIWLGVISLIRSDGRINLKPPIFTIDENSGEKKPDMNTEKHFKFHEDGTLLNFLHKLLCLILYSNKCLQSI